MTTYNLYKSTKTGEIDTLYNWQEEYLAKGLEAWHGKSVEECDPDYWMEDGGLLEISVTLTEGPVRTNQTYRSRVVFRGLGEDEVGTVYEITYLVLGEGPLKQRACTEATIYYVDVVDPGYELTPHTHA